MSVRRAEFRCEIDVPAELEHTIVLTFKDRFGLFRRQLKSLQIFRFVRLEGLAVCVLHQRHAEHVDAEPLARTFCIEDEGAGNVVVIVPFACHQVTSIVRRGALHWYKATNPAMYSAVPQWCARAPRHSLEYFKPNRAASDCRPARPSAAQVWARFSESCPRGAHHPEPPSACSDAASQSPRSRDREI